MKYLSSLVLAAVVGTGTFALGCGGSESNRGAGAGGNLGGGGGSSGTGGVAGAGGSGGEGGAPASLQVIETNPAADATDVELDAAISVRFDAALDSASVTSSSFTVRDADGEPLLGIVTGDVDGPNVIFTPRAPFGLMGTYTATVTTVVQSLEGGSLPQNYSWSFTMRDGAWGEPVLVQPDPDTESLASVVAVEPDGGAVALWAQRRSNTLVAASRYTPGSGWGSATNVQPRTPSSSSAGAPSVALGPAGEAFGVWGFSSVSRRDIWSSRSFAAGDWNDPTLIENNNAGTATNPKVAASADGSAIAVWVHSNGMRDSMWANRFTQAGGWGSPELIEHDEAGDVERPVVAMDAAGNAIAAWSQSDGTRNNIWANRFTPQSGWGAPELLEMLSSGPAFAPDLAMDARGNAIAVWYQSDSFFRYNVWANRFTPGGGWSGVEPVESQGDDAEWPQVALSSNGSAIVVWHQAGSSYTDVWANRFTGEMGWETPARLEIMNAGNAIFPEVAVDSNGNAIAVWAQDNGNYQDVWANRFTTQAGWSGAISIERADVRTYGAHVVMDASGRAVVVGQELPGSNQGVIWANHFE